ncbi:MAG: type 4a pilus biogenesis protein PilO [Coriobacteriia bacterium]|nr:type 4a pilus biogenesis protein PilO [Coriobacteriia bacterium]
MKLSPRIKVALVLAGCFLIVLGVVAGTLYPQYKKSTVLKQEKLNAQADLLAARTLLAKRTQLAKESGQLAIDTANQKAEIPESAQLSDVLRQIQNIAYENNHWMVNITNTDPVTTVGMKYLSWDTEISLEGGWLDTLSFLRDLRDMNRQVRVTNVAFTRLTGIRGGSAVPNRVAKHWDPEAYPVKTIIKVQIYYIPQSSVLSAASASTAAASTSAATTQGGAK